jgi:2-(3-amino-3-carboxypropyl)histidine synthase
MTLNFELDKLKSKLLARAPKKVLVQLPEGVKQNAFEVKKVIEDLDIEVIFSGETVWGGCALAVREAREVGADLIVHFGHAEFIEVDFPVLYMEIKDELDLDPILKKSLEQIKDFKKLGVSYAVQHRQDIEDVIKFYESNGKEVVLSEKKGYAAYPGHVVGCEFGGLKSIQDSVEAFLVIGNNFHSMGAALAVEKPIFLLDVYNNCVTEMKGVRDKIIRQRILSIEKVREAKKIGIISEIKPGQKFGVAKFLKEKLEKTGKRVILIAMDEMTPDKLMNFYDVDAFVELGCPRIAIDDFAKYSKPLITYKEALVVAGDMKIEELMEKGFV